MLQFLVNHGIGISLMFSPVIVGIITWLLTKLIQWLKSKTDNEVIRGILDFIEKNVPTVVKEQEQILKQMLKEVRSEHSDGGVKITAAEKRRIKQAAIDQLKLFLGKKYGKARKALKLSEVDMDKLLAAKVEEGVYNINKS